MSAGRRELGAPARLGVFGAGLALVLAAAIGLGRATGEVAQAAPAAAPAQEHGGDEAGELDGGAHRATL